MADRYVYVGEELDLFAHARNWKSYFRSRLRPFIRGDVLEIGAGIGGTTRILFEPHHQSWTCLEPDLGLAERLGRTVGDLAPAERIRVRTGTVADLPAEERFDAILYIDVLEHIKEDASELARSAGHLREGGALVVLAPAHQRLFTPFDAAIGHYRRYNRAALAALAPPGVRLERLFYLDSVGLLASLGNRFLLQAKMPTPRQIWVWDRFMVPLSRCLDSILGYRVGKSVVAIWRSAGTPGK